MGVADMIGGGKSLINNCITFAASGQRRVLHAGYFGYPADVAAVNVFQFGDGGGMGNLATFNQTKLPVAPRYNCFQRRFVDQIAGARTQATAVTDAKPLAPREE